MLAALRRRRTVPGAAAGEPRATPSIDPGAVLASLPNPIIVLDRQGLVRFLNPAAEQFLGTSSAALCGSPLTEVFAAQSPVFGLVDSLWRVEGSIAEYDVLLEGPRFLPRTVTIQGALTAEGSDTLVLTLHERSIADKIG